LSVGVGPQRADLVPITVHFDPSSPKVGDNVRVVATVENQGSGVAGEVKASFSVLLDEYVTFAHATDGALGSGGQTDLLGILDTKAMRLEEGTYKVRILVDPDNKIVEENEANNTFVDELQISGRGPTVTLVEGTSGVIHHLAIGEQAAMVYLASRNGKLFRVQAGNMQASLAFDAGNPITAFALDEGSSRAAYLGTSTGKLLVYGLDRGEEICHVSVDENNSISAVAFDRFGNIYAGTSTNVVSVAGDCSSLRWEYGLGEGEVVTALAVHNARNRVYVATSMPSSGRLYAFALTQTGVENPVDPDWELTFSSPLSALALDGALDGRIWVGTENGEVQAVTFTGRLDSARTYMTGGAVTGIVLDLEHRDPLYATTDEGKLYGLNLAGELRWVFPLEGTAAPIPSAAAVDGSTGDVIFGTNDGSLYTVDSQGNPVWVVEGFGDSESGVISSPVVGRVVERDGAKVAFYRVIYFGTSDGKVYLAKEAF
ncbi:PQQ-binding-like beta-propeller repeat protein, partial [Candidatus Bipolaricaulota bacterium]|nr:PQQ-binding-like beta-propeller repeat protein [Candidatus Bipolaricaulota bacterium]